MNNDWDYSKAGFDGFLSRSIDDLSQVNLNSQGPMSTQLRYDSSQVSGFLGDSFWLGGVGLEGKDNRIITRDGQNIRVIIGQQSDGTQGITVSKPNADADIKRPADLIFNSNQNVFKIALAGSYVFPSVLNISPSTSLVQSYTIFHGLGYVPAYLTYAFVYNQGSGPYLSFPTRFYQQFDSVALSGDTASQISNSVVVGVDERNLYLSRTAFNGDGVSPHDATELPVKYYILQETAS